MKSRNLATFGICVFLISGICIAQETPFTKSFNLENCIFTSTGRNDYFILEPGYQLIFEKQDNKEVKLVITVLNETKRIGNIETRVVEERETANGKLKEVSRNYYAIAIQTNSVFYFGEDVDNYKNGKIVNHGGSWVADSGGAKPGLMMPGIVLEGARYYEEIAPGVAMDKGELLSNEETITIPAGEFHNCLKIAETSDLEPQVKEYKFYAPGIGLIYDYGERLLLTKYLPAREAGVTIPADTSKSKK